MTLKQALWEIVRDENIIITNQNIDWLLERASKKAFGDTDILKESILERKDKLDKLGEPENKSNEELFKQALVEGLNRHFDKTIEEAKKIEQIEEMARTLCKDYNTEKCVTRCANYGKCTVGIDANTFYFAGYRQQSEVIDEFAEKLKEAPIKCGLPLLGLSTKEEIEEYFNGIMLQVRDAIDNIAKEMKGGV